MPSGAAPDGGVLFSTVGSKGEGTAGAVAVCSGGDAGLYSFQVNAATAKAAPAMRSAMAGQGRLGDLVFLPMRLMWQDVGLTEAMQARVVLSREMEAKPPAQWTARAGEEAIRFEADQRRILKKRTLAAAVVVTWKPPGISEMLAVLSSVQLPGAGSEAVWRWKSESFPPSGE